jgi:hypothetical protein
MTLRRIALAALPLSVLGCGDPTSSDDDAGIPVLDEVYVGSLVITEVQANPNSGRPEWVEVTSDFGESINLIGCQLTDGGATPHAFDILTGFDVVAGQRLIFASDPFLGAAEGERPADLVWGEDLALNQQDDTEFVALLCPDGTGTRQEIDRVAFNWGSLGVRRGRSWQFAGELDAFANDDPASWCEAPTQPDTVVAIVDGDTDYGTPGAATVCETPAGPSPDSAGDIVITEILAADFDGLREWFEVYNPGTETYDLRGCQIIDEAVAGGSEPNIETLDAESGTTVLPPMGYLLFASAGTDVTSDGSLVADYAYSGSLSFNNSELQSLGIACPVGPSLVTIDEVNYDWGTYGTEWRGYTLSLDAGHLDAEDNDEFANWCLARAEDTYFSTTTGDPPQTQTARGTPRATNPLCPVPAPHPLVGELVITEVMVYSSSEIGSNEEWFEVKNLSDHPIGLAGCTVRTQAGADTPDDDLIENPHGFDVAAADYAVLVKSSAADSIACGLPWDQQYGSSLNFLNSDPQTLSVLCPGPSGLEVVDAVSWDGGFAEGIAWQLKTSQETPTGNDVAANWCNDVVDAAWTWTCSAGDPVETNRGTPGGPSTCP